MDIELTTRIFKEGRSYVAHALELDLPSCGGSKERALKNLKEAVHLFLEEDIHYQEQPAHRGNLP
jgi:hypothetical protein